MNGFRLAADLCHLLAIILLLLKIWRTRSCAGISGKSQILFALVYTTRYLDLFYYVISPYNSVMKVVFISASYTTLYLMYVKFKATYDHNDDTFRIEFLVIPVAILAVALNQDFTPLEVLWTFSIYLESVAILPQLFLVSKTGKVETIIFYYLFCLGSYRTLYILNWAYRYYSEGFYDPIAIIAGIVQTVPYCYFFYKVMISPCVPDIPVVEGGKVPEIVLHSLSSSSEKLLNGELSENITKNVKQLPELILIKCPDSEVSDARILSKIEELENERTASDEKIQKM